MRKVTKHWALCAVWAAFQWHITDSSERLPSKHLPVPAQHSIHLPVWFWFQQKVGHLKVGQYNNQIQDGVWLKKNIPGSTSMNLVSEKISCSLPRTWRTRDMATKARSSLSPCIYIYRAVVTNPGGDIDVGVTSRWGCKLSRSLMKPKP